MEVGQDLLALGCCAALWMRRCGRAGLSEVHHLRLAATMSLALLEVRRDTVRATKSRWRVLRTPIARCVRGTGGGAGLAMSVCCCECRNRQKHRQRQRLALCLRVRMVPTLLLHCWKRLSCLRGVMVEVGGFDCRRRQCCGPQRLLRRWCGVDDEGGRGNSQDDNGVGDGVRKMNKVVLYLMVADSVAGVLLFSSLVKGCWVWSALSTAQGTYFCGHARQAKVISTTTPANSAQKHGIDILLA